MRRNAARLGAWVFSGSSGGDPDYAAGAAADTVISVLSILAAVHVGVLNAECAQGLDRLIGVVFGVEHDGEVTFVARPFFDVLDFAAVTADHSADHIGGRYHIVATEFAVEGGSFGLGSLGLHFGAGGEPRPARR